MNLVMKRGLAFIVKVMVLFELTGEVFAACTEGDLAEDTARANNHFFLKKYQSTCADSLNYFTALNTAGLHRKTLSDFKVANGYDATRVASAQYYNNGDLGFGRNMVCWSKDSNATEPNVRLNHLACYVGNHGVVGSNGSDQFLSISSAKLNHKPFATVAMEFNRGNATNPIAFFAYDANGNSVTQVELDSEGQKYIPGACTVCHGGKDVAKNGQLVGANFLPFDYNTFKFIDDNKVVSANDDNKGSAAISSQLLQIKKLNFMVRNQQDGNLNTQIRDLISNVLYPAGQEKLKYDDLSHASALGERYCRGCHVAQSGYTYGVISNSVVDKICSTSIDKNGAMPHAELSALHAYDHAKDKSICTPVQTKYLPKPRDPVTPVVNVSSYVDGRAVIVERKFGSSDSNYNGRPKFFPIELDGSLKSTSTLLTSDAPPYLLKSDLNRTAWVIDVVGDFNGDKINDLLWRNYRTGSNKIYFINNSFSVSGVRDLASVRINFKVIGMGNFDGNGNADIVWTDENTGAYYIQDIDNFHEPRIGEEFKIGGQVFNNAGIGKNFKFLGIGNFGDQKGTGGLSVVRSDLLFKGINPSDADNGVLYAVSISADLINSAASIPITTVTDQEWYVAAIGDTNNDSYDDIIFRNIKTEEVWLYTIANYVKTNEGPVTPAGEIRKVPNDWVLVGAAKKSDGTKMSLSLAWRNIQSANIGGVDKAQFVTWTFKNQPNTNPGIVNEVESYISE